jgi:hypothetical protein
LLDSGIFLSLDFTLNNLRKLFHKGIPNRNTSSNYANMASKLEIYNIAGQLVKTFNNIISNQQLDSTNLEKGLYLIKITDTNGISQTKKMLKE